MVPCVCVCVCVCVRVRVCVSLFVRSCHDPNPRDVQGCGVLESVLGRCLSCRARVGWASPHAEDTDAAHTLWEFSSRKITS